MELRAAEIFDEGTWNNVSFTSADLDAIVASFDALGLSGKIPLKYGHDGPDARTDSAPALGWVSRIYRQGTKLVADFTDLAADVAAAIKNGAYRFVSIELLRNVQAGTRKLPWVLDAVALLGATAPAVGTLKPLALRRNRPPFDSRMCFSRPQEGSKRMTDQNTDAQVAALTARIVKMELEAAVANGRILPADRDRFSRRNPDATLDEVATFVAATPKPADFHARPSSRAGTGDAAGLRADAALAKLVADEIEAAADKGRPITHAQAVKRVFRREPQLVQAWQQWTIAEERGQ